MRLCPWSPFLLIPTPRKQLFTISHYTSLHPSFHSVFQQQCQSLPRHFTAQLCPSLKPHSKVLQLQKGLAGGA